METSVIIASVGIRDLLDCLESMHRNPLPNEIIVVIDEVGRALADGGYKIENDIRSKFPEVIILYNANFDNWAMINQTYNIGIRASKSEYVMLTHEDVVFPKFDYFQFTIEGLMSQRLKDEGCEYVGVVFPVKQLAPTEETGVTERDTNVVRLGTLTAVSAIIKKSCIEEIGYLDENFGIFYDVHLSVEMERRNKYFINVPAPPMRHKVSQSLLATRNADEFRRCPIWRFASENFMRRYGRAI